MLWHTLVICILTSLIACGGGGGGSISSEPPSSEEEDTMLGSNSIGGIEEGATNISVDGPFTITFSNPIDISTANTTSICLTKFNAQANVAKVIVGVPISCNASNAVATQLACTSTTSCAIILMAPLDGFTRYALIFSGLRNADRTNIDSQMITFTTGIGHTANTEEGQTSNSDSQSNTTTPSVQFSITSAQDNESTTSVSIPIALSNSTPSEVTLLCSITGGTASNSDYVLNASQVSIPPNITTANILLSIANDVLVESDETIIISLSSPTNATLGNNAQYTYTIINDDVDLGSIWTRSIDWALGGMDSADALPTLLLNSARLTTSLDGSIAIGGLHSVDHGGSCTANDDDFWALIFSASGSLNSQWSYPSTCGGNNYGRNIAYNATGTSFYVAGSTPGIGDDIAIKKQQGENWLATLDVDTNNDLAYGITLDTNDNIYTIGQGGTDIFLTKFDSSGLEQTGWHKSIAGTGSGNDRGYDIALDNSGNIYVTGFTYTSNNGGQNQLWLASYDSSGSLRWENFNTTGMSAFPGKGKAVAVDDQGLDGVFIYVVGTIKHADRTDDDILVAKYNGASGAEIWISRIDDPLDNNLSLGSNDEATGIVLDTNHNLYISGFTQMTSSDNDFYTDADDYDMVLLKITSSIQTAWVKSYGGPVGGDDRALDVAVTDDGGGTPAIYLLGWEQMQIVSTQPSTPVLDDTFRLVLQRYDANGNTANEPRVTSTTPTTGATNVALTVSPVITFSESMDPDSIYFTSASDATFKVMSGCDVNMNCSATILGAVSTSNNLTFTFTPSENLSPATTYYVWISKDVENASGNPLGNSSLGPGNGYIWSFTTTNTS